MTLTRKAGLYSTVIGLLVVVPILMHAQFAASSGTNGDRGERRPVILVAGICSENPGVPMLEIYPWLKQELKYTADEILLFSYASATPLSSPDPSVAKYGKTDTTKSIDGEGGSAALLRSLIFAATSKGSAVDIIAHSQGGVVSLYAALDLVGQAGPSVAGKIHSITTINSPVRGVDTLHFVSSLGLNCAGPTSDSVQDMEDSFLRTSPAIRDIVDQEWNSPPTRDPYIVTIGNTRDFVVSDDLFPDGRRAVLEDTAHVPLLYDAGTTPNRHEAPLRVASIAAAAPTRTALLDALISRKLNDVFLAATSYLRSTTARPSAAPLDLTSAFVGNETSQVTTTSAAPQILTGFAQTSAFLGNESSRISTRATIPEIITSFAQSQAFLGNDSAAISSRIAEPPIATGFRLTRVFTGNESSALAGRLYRPFATPALLAIPSLTQWASVIMAAWLGSLLVWRLRRRRSVS